MRGVTKTETVMGALFKPSWRILTHKLGQRHANLVNDRLDSMGRLRVLRTILWPNSSHRNRVMRWREGNVLVACSDYLFKVVTFAIDRNKRMMLQISRIVAKSAKL